MQLKFSAEDEQFRQEVKSFLKESLPPDIARRGSRGFHPATKDDRHAWYRVLNEKGWSAPYWPKEYGGTGWSVIRQHIFEEECYAAHAPQAISAAFRLFAPVLYTFGTEEQKARYLPNILNGTELWMQGFSEPNAGSDLASLRTRAVRDGDHYVVNGQKTWSSEAQYAKRGFFLVRTDATVKPQKGISFLVIDMDMPGVTVRPIIGIDGGHNVNEVFLENVRVPADNLIGEEGKGWDYAKFLLKHERTASAEIYWTKAEFSKLKDIAQNERVNGVLLADTPEFSRKLARLEIDLIALEWSVLRVLTDEKTPYDSIAVAGALKIRGSQLQQRVTTLAMEALGLRGLRFFDRDDPGLDDPDQAGRWPSYVPGRTAVHMYMRACTVYGGSMEIQKTIISKLAFGL